MLRNVAVVVLNEFAPFEFGVVCEVFGIDRSEEGLPVYDFAVVAGESGPLRSRNEFTIQPRFGLERLAEADLIALPAISETRLGPRQYPQALLAELRAALDPGAPLLSVCRRAVIL